MDGTVNLRITISKVGRVSAAEVIDGPDMLRDAATQAVSRWTFRPFQNAQGLPVVASGMVELKFTLAPEDLKRRQAMRDLDGRTQARFFPLQDQCHIAIRAGVAAAPSTACIDAAELAKSFNPQERYIERRSAYVYAALWFLQDNDGEKALPYAELAVQEVQKGHDDDSGNNAAYTVRGEAEALIGQLSQANDDLRTAEELERKALVWAATAGDAKMLITEYTSVLRRNLRVRATVLKRLGKLQQAEEQTQECTSWVGERANNRRTAAVH